MWSPQIPWGFAILLCYFLEGGRCRMWLPCRICTTSFSPMGTPVQAQTPLARYKWAHSIAIRVSSAPFHQRCRLNYQLGCEDIF